MSYSYADRKRAESAVPQTEKRNGPGPSQDALRAGTVKPTAEQMGHRVDLPNAIREKMEGAFGADLSAVKLYESEAVADAGANAITQGANIAFAPGMLDFSSYGGQALLGHELSHVVSQARGEVTGGGFLNDHALEARADREGAMAASGQTVAMPTAAMSGVSAAAAAGPMQADKLSRKNAAISQANEIETAFTNDVYSQDPRKARDRSAFEELVQNASPRALRELSKRSRIQQDKYERHRKGQYTFQERLAGEDDYGPDPRQERKYRQQKVLLYMNMDRAAKAVRKGEGYRIDRTFDDFYRERKRGIWEG